MSREKQPTDTARPVPHENSHWVPGSLLLAGDYAGHKREDLARVKLNALLDAGVRRFIDLTTTADNMTPYHPLLMEEAEKRGVTVQHLPYPMPDMSVPAMPEDMNAVLAAIEEADAAGEIAYVHCWGGIGRTGTVVACHLIERGASPEDALDMVQRLYSTMSLDKTRRHPRSPQADKQFTFVRSWGKRNAK